jgi:hypothetical protein
MKIERMLMVERAVALRHSLRRRVSIACGDARRSGTLASDVVTFALPRDAGLSTENAAQL